MSETVRIAMIGAGAVADYHHVPGINIDPRAELVAVCDPNEALLEQRRTTGGSVGPRQSSRRLRMRMMWTR